MKLQYQLSNGNWVNCKKSDTDDRTDEFLAQCAEYKNISIDEVLAILATGKSVANCSGWSNECRDGEIVEAKTAAFAAQRAAAEAAEIPARHCAVNHAAKPGVVAHTNFLLTHRLAVATIAANLQETQT